MFDPVDWVYIALIVRQDVFQDVRAAVRSSGL